MCKHWKKAAAFLVLVVIGVGATLWWMVAGNPVTRRNYFQVQFDMSRADVERILGMPGGEPEWAKHETCAFFPMEARNFDEAINVPVETPTAWGSGRVFIRVWFDGDGKVLAKQMTIRHLTGFWGWLSDKFDPGVQAAPGAV